MLLKNALVTLSFPEAGVLTSPGSYEYKERTSSGSILEDDQRLFIVKRPEYSNCFKRVLLSEKFVNHSISDEGRPRREGNFKAYTFWRRMSETERLHYHISQYVIAMGGTTFDYNIIEA